MNFVLNINRSQAGYTYTEIQTSNYLVKRHDLYSGT